MQFDIDPKCLLVPFFQMKNHIYKLYGYSGFLQNVIVHLYKIHVNNAAPIQYGCGHGELDEKKLQRHMQKKRLLIWSPSFRHDNTDYLSDEERDSGREFSQKGLEDERHDCRNWNLTDAG